MSSMISSLANTSAFFRYNLFEFTCLNLRKLWIDVVKADNDKIRLHSVELQLIGYSWPDPTRHAIELVVFKPNMEDGYGECIFEVSLVKSFWFVLAWQPNVQPKLLVISVANTNTDNFMNGKYLLITLPLTCFLA